MGEQELLFQELESAIDQMDIDRVEDCLARLSSEQTAAIQMEEPKLFAARIAAIGKEQPTVRGSKKHIKVAALVAAMLTLGVTAYAANSLGFFDFVTGGKFVTVRSNNGVTEAEVRQMVQEGASAPRDDANAIYVTPEEFSTIEAAEAALDMKVILPQRMPKELALTGISGYAGSDSTLWLEYEDEAGRMLGLTLQRYDLTADTTSYTLHDMDEGSLGSYRSAKQQEYTLLTESDESGEQTAHIAFTQMGAYEYAVVFVGFDQAQQRALLDSLDLSDYAK